MPKTKEELQKISEETRFGTGIDPVKAGRSGGIKSGIKRRETKLLKEIILERMNETDWEEMADNLISRAKETDKAFETFRDTIGQMPQKDVRVEVETPTFIDDINE